MKYYGAIEFQEQKWKSMDMAASIDLMYWLNENLEPGYQIYKAVEGKTYFVGDSESLFEECHILDQKYPVYHIVADKCSLVKTDKVFNTL